MSTTIGLLISSPAAGEADARFVVNYTNVLTPEQYLFPFDSLEQANLFLSYCENVALFRNGLSWVPSFHQRIFDEAVSIYPEMLIADYCRSTFSEELPF